MSLLKLFCAVDDFCQQILMQNGIHLITKLKSNMKNKLMLMTDKLLLRKRSIIETINDQLKNISQIEHSHYRSPINFLVNLVSALIAYSYQPKKPSLNRFQFPFFWKLLLIHN